jgi:DNA-binding phage protein
VEILEYLDPSGRSPYRDWFDELDTNAAAKITVAITRMRLGNFSNAKGVGTGVQEYRSWISHLLRKGWRNAGDPACRRDKEAPAGGHPNGAGAVGGLQAAQEGSGMMALTRDFKETVKARAERDAAFREALLTEAVELLIAGDLDVGKALLRDYINATVGFEKLAKATGTPSKSLMRMLGPKGNPRASNLLTVIGKLQRVSGVHLAVAAGK